MNNVAICKTCHMIPLETPMLSPGESYICIYCKGLISHLEYQEYYRTQDEGFQSIVAGSGSLITVGSNNMVDIFQIGNLDKYKDVDHLPSCPLDGPFEKMQFIAAEPIKEGQMVSLYNNMLYGVKTVDPKLAIKPPMWTSKCADCRKEMLVDTREEKRCIPCDKQYHMRANTCDSCEHYSIKVFPVCRHSTIYACNPCYDKFIDWHGDVGILVDGDMIERAFTSWRMLETTNPPHFEIGFKQKKEK